MTDWSQPQASGLMHAPHALLATARCLDQGSRPPRMAAAAACHLTSRLPNAHVCLTRREVEEGLITHVNSVCSGAGARLRRLQVREARHEHVHIGLGARDGRLDQVGQVAASLAQRAIQPQPRVGRHLRGGRRARSGFAEPINFSLRISQLYGPCPDTGLAESCMRIASAEPARRAAACPATPPSWSTGERALNARNTGGDTLH